MEDATTDNSSPAEAAAGEVAVAPKRRTLVQFFSTASAFDEPVGSHIDPREPRGYYLDLSVKAKQPAWPESLARTPGRMLWVVVTQMGLGAFERYLAGDGEQWVAFSRELGDMVVASMAADGDRDGGLVHHFDFPHTIPVRGPWLSGMAQGQAASLLVRLFKETGEERYADGARRAVKSLSVPTRAGGTQALLDGRPFPEEYPSDPPSFVLNGGIFAIWGLYDVATALADGDAREAWQDTLETLSTSIFRWDTGSWSRYDLYPRRVVNVASLAYHHLHIAQLQATTMIAARPELERAVSRFEQYAGSRAHVAAAFARKALFRTLVPRSPRRRRPS